MAQIICEQCKATIDVVDNYAAPFIQCPSCGSHQKYTPDTSGQPKFKILDAKGRERAANNVVSEEIIVDESPAIPVNKPIFAKTSQPVKKFAPLITEKPIDTKSMLIDSMGEEGLQQAYKLAAEYIGSKSERTRKNGRAKAMKALMKLKFPADLATKALEFAEKAPETAALVKNTNNKIIIVVIVLVIIIAAIVFI